MPGPSQRAPAKKWNIHLREASMKASNILSPSLLGCAPLPGPGGQPGCAAPPRLPAPVARASSPDPVASRTNLPGTSLLQRRLLALTNQVGAKHQLTGARRAPSRPGGCLARPRRGHQRG